MIDGGRKTCKRRNKGSQRSTAKDYKALIEVQKGGRQNVYERFLTQSYVASDFCGSFGVKTASLFPPFDLPA